MANKQMILDAISQALDAMGISGDVDTDDVYDENGMMPQNQVPVWSQLDASMLGQGNGPIHSKDSLMKGIQMSKPPQVDNYGMPASGDQEEMMTAMGLV